MVHMFGGISDAAKLAAVCLSFVDSYKLVLPVSEAKDILSSSENRVTAQVHNGFSFKAENKLVQLEDFVTKLCRQNIFRRP
jgi:hypothetical protein